MKKTVFVLIIAAVPLSACGEPTGPSDDAVSVREAIRAPNGPDLQSSELHPDFDPDGLVPDSSSA